MFRECCGNEGGCSGCGNSCDSCCCGDQAGKRGGDRQPMFLPPGGGGDGSPPMTYQGMTTPGGTSYTGGGMTTPGGSPYQQGMLTPGGSPQPQYRYPQSGTFTPRSGMQGQYLISTPSGSQMPHTPQGIGHPDLGGGLRPPHDPHGHLHGTASSVKSQVVDEKADRGRATEVSRQTDRQWVAVTAYQPIDTVVKTVEVPVIRTVKTYVPKVIVEKKISEVPRYVHEYVDKFVEVPEVQVHDKIVEEIEYQYQYKYVPKVEIKENIIQRPKIEKKYIEKIVYVPEFKEVVRYKPVETVEEVIRYVPKGEPIPEEWATKSGEECPAQEVPSSEMETMSVPTEKPPYDFTKTPLTQPFPGQPPMYMSPPPPYGQPPQGPLIPGTPFDAYVGPTQIPPPDVQAPQIEQVFKPKVVQTVEIQKQVPVAVDVPVPYMVPKPVVVPVEVPVLKFRDSFTPVPVRRRVIPRIRYTNEIYEVECIQQKPFLRIQDVIKPVPCDITINVHSFVEKASPINPAELSQADVHAMWMRCNADLAEKRKEELGEKYPYVKYPPGTVFGEPGCSKEDAEGSQGGADKEGGGGGGEDTSKDPEASKKGEKETEPISLHPGHPLAMTYLQNQWIKKETTATHQMYTPEWFEAHQKALHTMTMQYPTQIQLTAEQASSLHPGQQAFGEAPWLATDEKGLPVAPPPVEEEEGRCCKCCGPSKCCTCNCGGGGEPNPDAACCSPC